MHFDLNAVTLDPSSGKSFGKGCRQLAQLDRNRAVRGVDNNRSRFVVRQLACLTEVRRSDLLIEIRQPEKQSCMCQYVARAVGGVEEVFERVAHQGE